MRTYERPRRLLVNLVGKVFGRLKVISLLGAHKRVTYWRCLCECGKSVEVRTANLRNGNTKSCGCLSADKTKLRNTKHGLSSMRAYASWSHMMARVYDEKCDHYHRYGGRGLIVEARFHDVAVFVAYMGECPEGMTLERVDNDAGYVTGNMVWATSRAQSRNKSTNVFVNLDGQRAVVSDAAKRLEMPRSTLARRLDNGLTISDAAVYPKYAKRIFHVDGRQTTLRSVADSTGIKYGTLWHRINVQGLSVAVAISMGGGIK